jgi:hypothetical protein
MLTCKVIQPVSLRESVNSAETRELERAVREIVRLFVESMEHQAESGPEQNVEKKKREMDNIREGTFRMGR